jgi:hypothetical protein
MKAKVAQAYYVLDPGASIYAYAKRAEVTRKFVNRVLVEMNVLPFKKLTGDDDVDGDGIDEGPCNQSYETAGTVSVGLGQLISISPLAFAMNNINPSGRSSKKARVVGIAITRESRWNIRYNELLEVRKSSSFCSLLFCWPNA